ncbi:uncharacterized protein METZ01_LOCUS65644, partial [marine metagenome]
MGAFSQQIPIILKGDVHILVAFGIDTYKSVAGRKEMTVTTDTALISHLMRRAGFGAAHEEIEAYAEMGYEATVEKLLDPESEP